MQAHDFNLVVNQTLENSRNLLLSKNDAYNPDEDKLHTFKQAGLFQEVQPTTALGGMLSKHLVALQGYINDSEGVDRAHSIEEWDEKILDVINYCVLLRALVIDGSTYEGDKIDFEALGLVYNVPIEETTEQGDHETVRNFIEEPEEINA